MPADCANRRRNGQRNLENPDAMGPTDAPLFRLLSARMGWLSQREAVLAQNIANADTPDYRPKDLNDNDFMRLVQGYAGRSSRIAVHQTNQQHLEGKMGARLGLRGQEQRSPYEVSPDGNAVVLEEQTAKAATTALDHQLASNIYRKYVGMVKTALGASGA
ncbi:MAG: flagellar basal body rod protein FlgB [Geminicoccaceae bacterium]